MCNSNTGARAEVCGLQVNLYGFTIDNGGRQESDAAIDGQ